MEMYVRLLKRDRQFCYLPEPLVNIGISDTQVTQSCLYKPAIELPEGLILLQKHGIKSLGNVFVYDAWWRLLRNMKIFQPQQLQLYAPGYWPAPILALQRDLAGSRKSLLANGFTSKSLMYLSFQKNKGIIRKFAT